MPHTTAQQHAIAACTHTTLTYRPRQLAARHAHGCIAGGVANVVASCSGSNEAPADLIALMASTADAGSCCTLSKLQSQRCTTAMAACWTCTLADRSLRASYRVTTVPPCSQMLVYHSQGNRTRNHNCAPTPYLSMHVHSVWTLHITTRPSTHTHTPRHTRWWSCVHAHTHHATAQHCRQPHATAPAKQASSLPRPHARDAHKPASTQHSATPCPDSDHTHTHARARVSAAEHTQGAASRRVAERNCRNTTASTKRRRHCYLVTRYFLGTYESTYIWMASSMISLAFSAPRISSTRTALFSFFL